MADPLDRNENLVLAAAGTLALVFIYNTGLEGPALCCGLLVLALVALRRAEPSLDLRDPLHVAALRGVWAVGMCLVPLAFHLGTGQAVIASGKELWDAELLQADELLFGILFPRGQLALWADRNAYFNPSAFLGRVITEVLQITYVTYYAWGNIVVVMLLVEYVREPRAVGKWRRLRQMLVGWVTAYVLNFAINFLIPALSPRLFIQEEYHHELQGLFLGRLLQNAIKSAAGGDAHKPKSFGAFPSGHVGLTWLAAMAAQRLGYHKYAEIARWAAILMTSAVVYLRYHYAVDAIAATLLIGAGLWMGRMREHQQREDNPTLPP